MAAYNRGGLEALPDRPHPGRTPILPRDQEGRFLERIDAPPRPEDGVCELRGADIRRILEQEFAARYSLDGVYKLLHRLDYSSLMPRPQHPDADPEAQAIFKEVVVDQIAGDRGGAPRRGGPGLARGRGPLRPAGDAHAGLGPPGLAAAPACARTGGTSLYVLTAACAASGAAVRADHARVEHGGGQPVPGGVLAATGPRGACGAAVGQRAATTSAGTWWCRRT